MNESLVDYFGELESEFKGNVVISLSSNKNPSFMRTVLKNPKVLLHNNGVTMQTKNQDVEISFDDVESAVVKKISFDSSYFCIRYGEPNLIMSASLNAS